MHWTNTVQTLDYYSCCCCCCCSGTQFAGQCFPGKPFDIVKVMMIKLQARKRQNTHTKEVVVCTRPSRAKNIFTIVCNWPASTRILIIIIFWKNIYNSFFKFQNILHFKEHNFLKAILENPINGINIQEFRVFIFLAWVFFSKLIH